MRFRYVTGRARAVGAVAAAVATVAMLPGVASGASPWTITPSPSPGGSSNQLNSVSCMTSTWCMAVGEADTVAGNGKVHASVITEHWNGTTWSQSPNTLPVSNYRGLWGVSCVSTTWCMAVGFIWVASYGQAGLAELWNGTSWSPVRTTPSYQLNSVSCVSTTFCMAGGDGKSGVVETWDGAAWTPISFPSVNTTMDQVTSVSCTSATSCMALDLYDVTSAQYTAIDYWNGTSWSATTVPPPPTTGSEVLGSVWCTSAASCMAVGDEAVGNGTATAIAYEWNGASWSPTTLPASTSSNDLTGVDCPTSVICWAAGVTVGSIPKTLAYYWNGTAWTVSPTRNPSSTYNAFGGIGCSSATSCMAVGQWNSPTKPRTLVESI